MIQHLGCVGKDVMMQKIVCKYVEVGTEVLNMINKQRVHFYVIQRIIKCL